MLKVDQQLMAQQASRLLRGVHYAMKATGASSGIIALKEKYQRAINALTPLLPPDIRLHILPDVYPRRRRSADHLDGNWSPCSTRCITR